MPCSCPSTVSVHSVTSSCWWSGGGVEGTRQPLSPPPLSPRGVPPPRLCLPALSPPHVPFGLSGVVRSSCVSAEDGRGGGCEGSPAPVAFSAVGLGGSGLGEPSFSLLPSSEVRSCRGQPRPDRTSTEALKPAGRHRMRILVPFHGKQS